MEILFYLFMVLAVVSLIGALTGANIVGAVVFAALAGLFYYLKNRKTETKKDSEQQSEPKFEKQAKKDDSPGILIINQKPPKQYQDVAKRIKSGVSVVGIARGERQDTVERFINGSAQKVVLEKELDNEYDPNAIKVIGKWKDQINLFLEKEQEEMLGYIPKEIAAEISNKELLGCVNTIYKRTEEYNPGVKLDIYSVPSQETDNLIKPGTLDKKRRKEDTWTAYPLLVILTFGFPLIGIVLGIIGLAINKRGSWQLLLLGLVLWIVYALLLIEFWFSLFVI